MLESALGLPPQRYYRTLHDKAGVLLRSLIKNHPLVDGNKRVAMTATYVFLALNGHILFASNREMVDFALQIASDKPDMEWKQVAAWLKGRTMEASAKGEDIQPRLDEFSGEWRDAGRVRSRLMEYAEALSAVQKEAGG